MAKVSAFTREKEQPAENQTVILSPTFLINLNVH